MKVCLRKISMVSIALIISLAISGVWAAHTSATDAQRSCEHHQDIMVQSSDKVDLKFKHIECSDLGHEIECLPMMSMYSLLKDDRLKCAAGEREVLTFTHFQFLNTFTSTTLIRPPRV